MKNLLLIILVLTSLITKAQYNKGDNVILIGHNSTDILKELKIILADNSYSIKSIDTDIGFIETELKDLRGAQTRLMIRYNDSTAIFRGMATNSMTISGYGGGIGISSQTGEYRNEFRQSKLTVMAHGFNEMERVASILWTKYQKEFKVYRD